MVADTLVSAQCVDIQTNLESCGTCQGDVCTDIPGAISMACVAGKCVGEHALRVVKWCNAGLTSPLFLGMPVHECEQGLSPANNSTECL